MNRSLRAESGTNLVFSYRSTSGKNLGEISTITDNVLSKKIKKWVKDKDLKNDNGTPLIVNVSRFRKTFVNRIWELSGGDPFVTAALANHTVKVSQTHYLEAPKGSRKELQLHGQGANRRIAL